MRMWPIRSLRCTRRRESLRAVQDPPGTQEHDPRFQSVNPPFWRVSAQLDASADTIGAHHIPRRQRTSGNRPTATSSITIESCLWRSGGMGISYLPRGIPRSVVGSLGFACSRPFHWVKGAFTLLLLSRGLLGFVKRAIDLAVV